MNTTDTTVAPSRLIERLEWRYATKAYDSGRKIDPETWSALESALHLTASSGGLQPWAFVVVTDPEIRGKLVAASYGQTQVRDASHLVVFAARTDFDEQAVDAHVRRTAEVRDVPVESLASFRGMLVGGIVTAKDPVARREWAARQTYIALGTLLTSAALLGVDATPMEGINPAVFDDLLGLGPLGLTTTVIATLGYRSERDRYAAMPKVRFPKEQVFLRR